MQGIETDVEGGPFGTFEVTQLKGLAFTPDLGKTWKQYAVISEDRLDLPKVSAPGTASPVLYQPVRVAGWTEKQGARIQLARLEKGPSDPLAFVTVPTATNGYMTNFGGIGMPPTMNWRYRAFAVDPGDADHLIAADIFKDRMMETTDGGYSWLEMPVLTSQVTDGGTLHFSGRVFWSPLSTVETPVSQASAIEFYPDDPNMVAVGTVQNGVFISSDRGQSWRKVTGSEKATLVSGLHWRKADDLIVATYGRGLWRVRFKLLMPLDTHFCKSPDCFPIYVKKPPKEQPTPYDHVVLAYGGTIEGARIRAGLLEELFVRPSTTVAFATDLDTLPDVKVTETTQRVRFSGLGRMPRAPQGASLITGLTLKESARGSEVVGLFFAPRPRPLYTAPERGQEQRKPRGQERPPTEEKPYLEVPAGRVMPGATIPVAGRGLAPGSTAAIAIDGAAVLSVAADREGRFSATVQSPTQFGLHSLTLVDSTSGRTLDGTLIPITPADRPPSGARGP